MNRLGLMGALLVGVGASCQTERSGGPPALGGQEAGAACPTTTTEIQQTFLVLQCAMAGCHNATDQSAGLDLLSADLDARIVGTPALGCRGDTLVVPGHPEQSLFFRKIVDATPECGVRMPVGLPMPSQDIECIRRWIAAMPTAAPSDGGSPQPDSGGACPPGQAFCEGLCLDVSGDNANCGGCGRACAPGTVCLAGVCTCPAGQNLCESSCVDTSTDGNHCGGCGRACGPGSTCTDGRCACPTGQTYCGTACVDTTRSNANCGACGTACAANQTCAGGACVCNAGLSLCGDRCVDTRADASNCGACGKACMRNTVCAAGTCVRGGCPAGTVDCGNSCVDIQTNALHCGACGRTCAAGQSCSGGNCSCGAGVTSCGGACTDLSSDPLNCGACGKACSSGSSCTDGACGCSSGLTTCSGSCVNTTTDPLNCGTCGQSCTANQSCSGGSCSASCPAGTTLCGSLCVNRATDPKNCGACGHACASGETCSGGTCAGCGPSVSFSGQVQPIFNASCTTNCHGGNRPSAGLDLTPGGSHAALVGVRSGCQDGRLLVAPGSVSTSYLVNKLTGMGMCSGTQMPARGVSVSQGQIDAIRAWICQGAPKN